MASGKQEGTSVQLYSVSSEPNNIDSLNSNRPLEDEFMFRSSSPDSNVDYSGNMAPPSGVKVDDSNAYNLGQIFNKKRFAWLLEVDDTGDDLDMEKPLLYVSSIDI